MYRVKPIGLNLKGADRKLKDGFLQESINLQWRDNSFKPIPERLLYGVSPGGYSNIIFHKVGDEDQINVIGFNTNNNSDSLFLAFDLADYLVGGSSSYSLEWFGKIVDGEYSAVAPVQIPIFFTPGMSFTILNGILYFMGDGSTPAERYYYRLQFDDTTGTYIAKDMYAWKSLIPYYPNNGVVSFPWPPGAYNASTLCGLILIRFALVLKSGEVVLPSPIYGFILTGFNASEVAIAKDDLIENIHTVVNLNLQFADEDLFDQEVSAINIYATTPYYVDKFPIAPSTANSAFYAIAGDRIKGEFQRKAEENFYLIRTIDKPSDDIFILTIGNFNWPAANSYATIDMNTIAAGEVMPVDNFSYHKLYGKITSFNGRLIVERPRTVLSGGHMRSLALVDQSAYQSYEIDTEDGNVKGVVEQIDKAISISDNASFFRGMLSYPDLRASYAGGSSNLTEEGVRLIKCRGNQSHNLSCAFNFEIKDTSAIVSITVSSIAQTNNIYSIIPQYNNYDKSYNSAETHKDNYTSENRAQFSEAGEFSVWPAKYSYRIGEGKIMAVGNNSVNPSNAEIIAPLIIGTSEGVYTINFDPSGNNLVASITRTANIPYISSETLQIKGFLLFVSDMGLMAIQNGDVINLSNSFFPEQGDGQYPVNETVFEGYNALCASFFGGGANPYVLDDIIIYMRGAFLAYDARRNNIWCSNPAYDFSMIYNMDTALWTMSTQVFSKKVEFFSMVETVEGQIYSRFMVVDKTNTKMFILSGEDMSTEVDFHMLTRSVKFSPNEPEENADSYKQLDRSIVRCVLQRNTADGYFSFGLWGRQDVNKFKKSIPIIAKKDSRDVVFPNNVRQDIPVDNRKGKYKSVNISLTGKALPDSDIMGFDFDVKLVDDKRMR